MGHRMFHRWKEVQSMVATRNSNGDIQTQYKRWDSNSVEAKKLIELFKSGEIDPSERPKEIWTNFPIFQCFNLDAFRTGLNKIKGDLGLRVQRNDKSFVFG